MQLPVHKSFTQGINKVVNIIRIMSVTFFFGTHGGSDVAQTEAACQQRSVESCRACKHGDEDAI